MIDGVVSPFRYRVSNFICDNERLSISYKDINTLVVRGILEPIDFEILKRIYEFKYINRYNLEICINNDGKVEERFKKESYKKRLSLLSKYGIIHKNYFQWENANILERTPYVYTLSRGAVAFMKKRYQLKVNIDEYSIIESPEIVYKRLAANQFICQCIAKLESLFTYKINKVIASKKYKTSISLYGIAYMNYKGNEIPLVIEPVRKMIQWHRELQSRLKIIHDVIINMKFSKKSIFSTCPIIVFICEDDIHIKETHLIVSKLDISLIPIVYTTDVRLMDDSLSGSFITCFLEEGNIQLYRNSIDFLK